MFNEIIEYRLQYAVLIFGVICFSLLYMAAWPSLAWQRVVALLFGAFYFIWGTVTHLHADHLTAKLVWEYASVGLLVSSVLLILTW